MTKEEDEETSTLPSRLDRLIAFLDSYFGSVELIQPSSESFTSPPPAETTPPPTTTEAEPSAVADEAMIDSTEPAEKSEQEVAELVEVKAEERAEEIAKEKKNPRAPVIRVKLDDYFADVEIENLVSQLYSLLFGVHC